MPNLPAPYVSPWREFGRNLRALAADLRLRIQELWRRNGEGDLPQPGFWPKQLAAFFWPALLALLLAFAVGIWMRLSASSTSQAPVRQTPQQPANSLPAAPPPAPVAAPEASMDGHQDSEPLTQADFPGDREADPAPEPEPEPARTSQNQNRSLDSSNGLQLCRRCCSLRQRTRPTINCG